MYPLDRFLAYFIGALPLFAVHIWVFLLKRTPPKTLEPAMNMMKELIQVMIRPIDAIGGLRSSPFLKCFLLRRASVNQQRMQMVHGASSQSTSTTIAMCTRSCRYVLARARCINAGFLSNQPHFFFSQRLHGQYSFTREVVKQLHAYYAQRQNDSMNRTL